MVILRKLRQSYNKLVLDASRPVFALYLGLCGGLVAVLIDFDHVALVFGHPHGRIWHTPLLILALFVAVYCCARIGRLLPGLFLKNFLMILLLSLVVVAASYGLAYLMGEFFWSRFIGLY